ncbi:MAG: O-methyltransferase [Flavobacteriaceae bacterium]
MHFISDFLLEYSQEHSSSESELLKELYRETHQKILQPRMASSPLQGRLLSLISKLIQPNSILEIGTFTGYATLCLAEGLSPKGILHTIDSNEELVDFQHGYFKRSPFASQIQTHLGPALDIIPDLESPFDLVFIDADKSNYIHYYEMMVPKMRSGGLILSDNVLWNGKVMEEAKPQDLDTQTLQEFNRLLANDPRVDSVLVPLRDGITLTRVL